MKVVQTYKTCLFLFTLLALWIAPSLAMCGQEEIESAWDDLLAALSDSPERPFYGGSDLLLWIDDGDGGRNRLTALVAHSGALKLSGPGLFARVHLAERVYSGRADLNEASLAAYDRRGFDRLLKVDVRTLSGGVELSARAFWLDRDVWDAMLDPPRPYYERPASVKLPASPLWSQLERSTLEFGPLAPAWTEVRLFESSDRVLDIAAGDFDGDSVNDLALLFKSRIELWCGSDEGFYFRYTYTLSDDEEIPVRHKSGTLIACDISGNGQLEILFGLDTFEGGQALQWTGSELARIQRMDHAPLACLSGASGAPSTLIGARYAEGTPLFKSRLERLDDNFDGAEKLRTSNNFVSAIIKPGGISLKDMWLVTDTGALVKAVSKSSTSPASCGQNPATATGLDGQAVIACGAASFGGFEEEISIFAYGTKGFVAAGRCISRKGAVMALASAPGEGLRFYAARYNKASNKTYINVVHP